MVIQQLDTHRNKIIEVSVNYLFYPWQGEIRKVQISLAFTGFDLTLKNDSFF